MGPGGNDRSRSGIAAAPESSAERVRRRVGARLEALAEPRWPAILFAWIAIFLVGAKFAYLSGLAEYWDDGRLSPLLLARAIAYQARDLLFAFGLCLAVWLLLRRARRAWVRRIVLWAGIVAAGIVVLLGFVSAATLPILGSPLTAGMIVYSDLLFSQHGRIAVASWIPADLLWALAACIILAAAAVWAILSSRTVAGMATIGAVALTAFGAVFLATDSDRDSLRKQSAIAAFVNSLRVFDEASIVGDVEPADPFAGGAVQPAIALQDGARGRIENVVLVVLESAGARYFDQYGGPYAITPELTRLAPESLRGTSVYANTASSFPAMVTMLSGRQPPVALDPPLPRSSMLPQILRRAGLRTAFFHSSDTRAARAGDFLASAGFEHVRDYRNRPCDAPLIADQTQFLSQGSLDRCTFDEMERWIAAAPAEPFLAMLWTFQSHFDYFVGPGESPPALQPGEFAGDPRRAGNKARYLAALREADRQIGEFLAFLDREGLAESTLVVVTGDHGESFDDHGQFGHGGSLYESAVHVPLFLINRTLSPQRDFARPASHLDLAPTIVDVLDLPVPNEWDGSSLFRTARRNPVIFATPYTRLQVGYRLGERKVIGHLLDHRASVYDLATDPGEERDIAAGDRRLQQAELARIRAWTKYLNARAASRNEAP